MVALQSRSSEVGTSGTGCPAVGWISDPRAQTGSERQSDVAYAAWLEARSRRNDRGPAQSDGGPGRQLRHAGQCWSAPICPPAQVGLSMIRASHRTERVLASSPNGTVVTGLDIPV